MDTAILTLIRLTHTIIKNGLRRDGGKAARLSYIKYKYDRNFREAGE